MRIIVDSTLEANKAAMLRTAVPCRGVGATFAAGSRPGQSGDGIRCHGDADGGVHLSIISGLNATLIAAAVGR